MDDLKLHPRTRKFFVTSSFARAINGQIVQGILPAIAAAYFLTLDVWGSDLDFIKNNLKLHQYCFGFLLLATLASQIFRSISNSHRDKHESSYTEFLEDFMTLTARIVECKQARFRSIAPSLSKNGDAFKHITKPDDQVHFICEQAINWFRKYFKLTEEQLSITVIQVRNDVTFYAFKYPDGWQRSRAKDIMNSQSSAAAQCIALGQPLFHADKVSAQHSGTYFLSTRDEERGNGSVYCYPVVVTLPEGIEKYVVSITSYGKLLCPPADTESAENTKLILREMCRRLELELTLRSVRQWKFGE